MIAPVKTQMTSSQLVVRDYIALTKPRIVSLLLFTALTGMFLASGGTPDLGLVAVVMIGGTLASGGANALNQSMEQDLDGAMVRTRRRPVASGRITPRSANVFGLGLNAVAFALLATLANPLSAVLTLSATAFYVLVYTKGLKRSSAQNIVIGGAAGAIPPMVGWAAVTGSLALPALYLFAIVFFWTPPHFWALSLLIKGDYARAGVPMLPVVAGDRETKKAILLYTLLLTALTLMFYTTMVVGTVYLATAVALGSTFTYLAWRLWRQPDTRGAKRLYLYSLLYLALLFAGVIVDSYVRL